MGTTSESEQRLIGFMRSAPPTITIPDDQALPALELLERFMGKYNTVNQPSTPEQVTGALKVMAETIQCELPETNGLMMYVSLTNRIPFRVYQQIIAELLEVHKWRTLPLPAEILQSRAATRYFTEKDQFNRLAIVWRRRLAAQIRRSTGEIV